MGAHSYLIMVNIMCVLISAGEGNGSHNVLGSLHWCDTVCLCNHIPEKLQCFSDLEIYTLMDFKERKISVLSKRFNLREKLTWCNDTCLCHKHNQKGFKCTNIESLVSFIKMTSPSLVKYLEQEEGEIYDLRDTLENQEDAVIFTEEEEEESLPKHDRHRKKQRKDRKEKHKHHNHQLATTPSPNITELANYAEVTPPVTLRMAGVFGSGQQSSALSPERKSSSVEATPEGTAEEELRDLHLYVKKIENDADFNEKILLVTVVVAGLAMIGVLIMAIYLCCTHSHCCSSNDVSKDEHPHDKNCLTKAQLEEAW